MQVVLRLGSPTNNIQVNMHKGEKRASVENVN